MWYKNITGTFFGLVTKHACDRQTDRQTDRRTDRITTPKTALAQLRRAVKIADRTTTIIIIGATIRTPGEVGCHYVTKRIVEIIARRQKTQFLREHYRLTKRTAVIGMDESGRAM